MDTIHRSLTSAVNGTTATWYVRNPEGAKAYRDMNRLQTVWVCGHEWRKGCWTVWVSTTPPSSKECKGGWPTHCQRKGDALQLASLISRTLLIPMIVE